MIFTWEGIIMVLRHTMNQKLRFLARRRAKA